MKQYIEATRGELARMAAGTCRQVHRSRACEVERYRMDPARMDTLRVDCWNSRLQ
ncbi:MAG: hypothetical protein OJF52_001084 [Nitrospira sp.]|nr:MAG: hypothetical protein OJF52_001084 [Nitrospira sp.]